MRGMKGQVGLILIMIMAVVGAVSLSLASRSVTGLRTQETDIDSSQAFKAAEAGLERSLAESASASGFLAGEDLSYSATYGSGDTAEGGFVTDTKIQLGVAVRVLVEGGTNLVNNLRIYWSDDYVSGTRPAVKIAVYKDDGLGGISVEYLAVDGDSGRGNNFVSTDGSGVFESISFSDYKNVALDDTVTFIRVTPLYAETKIGVAPQGGMSLPQQQIRVTSVGTDVGANVSRAIEFTKTTEALPSVFDYVLFTTGGLSQ